MKKLLAILSLCLSFVAEGQIQYLGSPTTQIYVRGQLRVDTLIYLPLRDTMVTPTQKGAFIFRGTDNLPYVWDGLKWNKVAIGSTAWGQITGAISAQTDLINYLSTNYQPLVTWGYGLKYSAGHASYDSASVRKVDTLIRLNDSTIQYVLNGRSYNILVRGTPAGGISSLSLVLPSTIFNTPVIFTNTAGTWQGTASLINQAGNTFFAGPAVGGPAVPTFRVLDPNDIPSNIPNGKLQNSTISYSIGSSGSAPNWSSSPVALGGTAQLNLPIASPTVTGPLAASDYSAFSSRMQNFGGTPGWLSGTFASRPSAGVAGRHFTATDSARIYYDNGSSWVLISGGGGGISHVFRKPSTDSVFYDSAGTSLFAFRDTLLGIKTIPSGVIALDSSLKVGDIYNQSSWTNLSFFNNVGSNYSVSGGKIVTSNYSSGSGVLEFPNATMLDQEFFRLDFKYLTKNASDFGIDVFWNSIGNPTQSKADLAFYLSIHSGSVNKANIVSVVNGVETDNLSASALPSVSIGDNLTYLISHTPYGYVFQVINNTTSQSITNSISTSYTYPGAGVEHNTAKLQIYDQMANSTVEIDRMQWSSNQPTFATLLVRGNSIYNGSFAQSVAGRVVNIIHATNESGPGDITAAYLATEAEIIAQHPKNIFIEYTGNDASFGISATTTQSNLTTLYNDLTAAGINCYFVSPTPRNAIDLSSVLAWLNANYAGRVIDLFTPLLGSGTSLNAAYNAGDGVHINAAGQALMASIIQSSPIYLAMINGVKVQYAFGPDLTPADTFSLADVGYVEERIATASAIINQTTECWIDSTVGNNSTASIGRPDLPFRTIDAALLAVKSINGGKLLHIGIGNYAAPSDSSWSKGVRISGAKMPSYNWVVKMGAGGTADSVVTAPTALVNGTIIKGGVHINGYDDINFENIGIDCGPAFVSGGGTENDCLAIGYLTASLRTAPFILNTGIRIEHCVFLGKNPSSAFHCLLLQGLANSSVEDVTTCYGTHGVAFKGIKSQLHHIHTYSHQDDGIILKNDDYAQCQDVQLSGFMCTPLTGDASNGIIVENNGSTQMAYIQISNGYIVNASTGVTIHSLSGQQVTFLDIGNLVIRGSTGNGITATNVSDVRFHDISSGANGQDGFNISSNNNGSVFLSNCTAAANGDDGFDLTGGSGSGGVQFVDLFSYFNTHYGVNANASSSVSGNMHASTSNGSGATNGTINSRIAALADPGSNGIVTRTALNTTGTASFSDMSSVNITSGTYTPTLTGTTNITSPTLSTATYIRTGNIVTVTISGALVATSSATQSVLTISLPIARSASTQLFVGSGAVAPNAGGSSVYVSGLVQLDANTTTANFNFYYVGAAATGDNFSFTFSYSL